MNYYGYKILLYQKVSSTQDIARQILKNEKKNNFVVVAEIQEKGRGRGERKWISPEGGLYLSIVPSFLFKKKISVSFIVSYSIAKTIEEEIGISPQIKWPNDVLIQKRKVAGILVEKDENSFIIGIGVNLNTSKGNFPLSLRKRVISLKEISGRDVSFKDFLTLLLRNFSYSLNLLKEKGFSYILGKWIEYSLPIGEQIIFHHRSGIKKGFYWGVGKNGELYIRTMEGKTLSFEEGEIE